MNVLEKNRNQDTVYSEQEGVVRVGGKEQVVEEGRQEAELIKVRDMDAVEDEVVEPRNETENMNREPVILEVVNERGEMVPAPKSVLEILPGEAPRKGETQHHHYSINIIPKHQANKILRVEVVSKDNLVESGSTGRKVVQKETTSTTKSLAKRLSGRGEEDTSKMKKDLNEHRVKDNFEKGRKSFEEASHEFVVPGVPPTRQFGVKRRRSTGFGLTTSEACSSDELASSTCQVVNKRLSVPQLADISGEDNQPASALSDAGHKEASTASKRTHRRKK